MLALFTALLMLVEARDVPLLTGPRFVAGRQRVSAAAIGVGLLVADVALPVP